MRKLLVDLSTFAIACILPAIAFSQQLSVEADGHRSPASVYVLLQGKEIKLPEDFVARLDGSKLKVSLKSLGLAGQNRDRDMLVSLIQEDGSQTALSPDANGEMTFENVKQGLASIVVASKQSAYAAMAMYAVQGTLQVPSRPFEIPVASVDASQISAAVEASGNATPGPDSKKLSEFPSGIANRFRVYQRSTGALDGHVVIPEAGFENLAGGVNLAFFRDGVQIAKTTSAADGAFSVAGLKPGVHSVFASGPAGHSSFAFELVAPAASELPLSNSAPNSKSQFVAFQVALPPPADELIVLMIPPRMMPGVREVIRKSYPLPAGTTGAGQAAAVGGLPGAGGFSGGVGGLPGGSLQSGGFSGGGGGGFSGGGGGGFGGIGALLGVAGLATGVAALTNDDDGFNLPPATIIVP